MGFRMLIRFFEPPPLHSYFSVLPLTVVDHYVTGVRSRPASANVNRPHTSSAARPLTLGQREKPDGAGEHTF